MDRPAPPLPVPALAYAGSAFALGFVLGVLRIAVVAPRLGELTAVALELPVMLAASWVLAGRMLRVWPMTRGRAAAAGAGALALLLGLEAALSAALGVAPGAFLRGLVTPAGALGLAGQAVFALFPALRAGRGPARG